MVSEKSQCVRHKVHSPESQQDELRSQLDTTIGVHLQQPCGRSASWSFSLDSRSNECEMFLPSLGARIEQGHDHASVRINAGQIRALVQIAAATSPREVSEFITSTVLPRENMLYVKWSGELNPVGQSAILATRIRPLADLLPDFRRHQGVPAA